MMPTSLLSLPVLGALFAALVLFVYLVLNRQRRRSEKRPLLEETTEPRAQDTLAELASQVSQLQSRLEEVEQRRSPLSDWSITEQPTSLNLNRRGQVLRLHRRGDSVAHIASTLGLSTGEVALIVKVQQITPSGRREDLPASDL